MAFPAAAAMPLNSPRRPSTGRHILGTPGESHPSDRHKSTLFRAHRPCDRLSLDSVTAARGSTPRQRKCRVPLTVSKRNTHNRSHCFITAAAGAEQGLQGLGLHQALGVPQGSQRLSPRLHRSPSSPSTPQLAKGPLRCRHKSQVTSRKSQVTESQGPASQEWSQEEAQAGLPEPQPRAPLLLVPMLALALVLCNADRVIMSVTVVPLSVLNAWTPTTAGVVQSSFLWGYALTPILGGALADAWGGHPVLSAGMALWSAATLFTPLAALGHAWGAPAAAGGALGAPGGGGAGAVYPGRPLWPLLLVRAVMGVGEGVALPCMNNLVSRFVPKELRATAVATCFVGFHLGCMVGLLSAPALMSLPLPLARGHPPGTPSIGAPFLFFGAIGFLWLGLWSLLRGSLRLPHSAGAGPGAGAGAGSTQQRRAGRMPPFRLLLSKAPVWAIISANAVNNWGYFVLLSWMPLYFKQATGVDLRQAAWFSALPWAVMAAASIVAGRVADSLASNGLDTTRLRKLMQSIGFMGPGVSLLCLIFTRDANVAVCLLAAALATSSFSQAGFLLNYQDIAPRFVGVLHGISNTAGTLAGIGSTVISGMLVERFGSFTAVLTLTSTLYLVGTLIWVTFATGEVVFN